MITSNFVYLFAIFTMNTHSGTDSKYLNYIEDLDLSHIGVVIVPKSAFEPYSALIRLNMANASIQAIDDSWFSSNSSANKLMEMDLHQNKLKLLRRGHFRHLKQLRKLNVMNNDIEVIEQNTFQDLDQLTHLTVRSNQLTLLTYFGELNHLQYFDLGENLIGEVILQYSSICIPST